MYNFLRIKPVLSLLFALFIITGAVSAQLILRISELPARTPTGATLYAAGTFNRWNPADTAYRFTPLGDGRYELRLMLPAGDYEFKITRGSWEIGEGSATGAFRPNRQLHYSGGRQEVDVQISGWEGKAEQASTAAANVYRLTDSFTIPQLDRQRRIWIYLPPDYATSKKAYPVIYMHDGQNLFDAARSFSGEWEVDETLNAIFSAEGRAFIVIGIENGGSERIAEYTPWANPQYGGGRGEAYIDFIATTLKPYIDRHYRTLPAAKHTGIMGSSLGGLISLYAGLTYPRVFGRVGVFSPSLWFTNDIFTYVQQSGRSRQQRFYLLAGEGENSERVSVTGDLARMYDQLRKRGFKSGQLRLVTHPDGQHKEWYWARELEGAVKWLFAD